MRRLLNSIDRALSTSLRQDQRPAGSGSYPSPPKAGDGCYPSPPEAGDGCYPNPHPADKGCYPSGSRWQKSR
jgi:hypothetical protein